MANYTYANLINFIQNKKSNNVVPADKVANFLLNYAAGMTMRQSAEEADVKLPTTKDWKKTDWFEEALNIARDVAISKTDGKMSHLLETSLNALQSRLDRGDPYIAKDGTVKYKPVTAHHAAQITSIIFDKRALLRNQPTTIKGEKEISTEERLSNLGKRFEEMGKLKLVKDDGNSGKTGTKG